jgi:hypothetical protein
MKVLGLSHAVYADWLQRTGAGNSGSVFPSK